MEKTEGDMKTQIEFYLRMRSFNAARTNVVKTIYASQRETALGCNMLCVEAVYLSETLRMRRGTHGWINTWSETID